ncbi:Uncharacterised protein [Mycobacteroides abscessus subsp. abscessus]|nr:Uncharacterised protein [Mycobacteroides abscessus subsp. abscessus]
MDTCQLQPFFSHSQIQAPYPVQKIFFCSSKRLHPMDSDSICTLLHRRAVCTGSKNMNVEARHASLIRPGNRDVLRGYSRKTSILLPFVYKSSAPGYSSKILQSSQVSFPGRSTPPISRISLQMELRNFLKMMRKGAPFPIPQLFPWRRRLIQRIVLQG